MSVFSKIKLFRSNNNENSKDINDIIDTSDNSSRELTPEEKNMLNNVIGFGESRVEDCMVPRADIVGLELDTDVKAILKIFSEKFPVIIIKSIQLIAIIKGTFPTFKPRFSP